MGDPRPPRPVGITMIALLDFEFAVLAIRALVLNIYRVHSPDYSGLVVAFWLFGGFLSPAVLLATILAFPVGFGLLLGKGWAWSLSIFLTMLGVALFGLEFLPLFLQGLVGWLYIDMLFFQFAVPTVMLLLPVLAGMVILRYLARARVKAYFGK